MIEFKKQLADTFLHVCKNTFIKSLMVRPDVIRDSSKLVFLFI